MLMICHADSDAGPDRLALYKWKALEGISADGTPVPITLVYKEGSEQPAPLLLTSYGAYGMCADTSFNPERLSLLECG